MPPPGIKKRPPNPEKEAAKRKRIADRNMLQEPIKKNLKARGCCHQEIGNMLRSKCRDILAKHPNPDVVRFCLPNYPADWIKDDKIIKPWVNYVNEACSNAQMSKPLFTNHIGGYLLFLLRDETSGSFVRDTLPELNSKYNQALREPTSAEIAEFHAGWTERSPNMFPRH